MILGVIQFYGEISCLLYFLLTSTEIIVLKVVYIYKFSTIAAVNEYFLKNILILFNITVIGIFIFILLTLKEYETAEHLLLSCIRSQNPLNQLSVRTDEHKNVEL